MRNLSKGDWCDAESDVHHIHLNVRLRVVVRGDVVGVEVVGHDGMMGWLQRQRRGMVGYGGVWWVWYRQDTVWVTRKITIIRSMNVPTTFIPNIKLDVNVPGTRQICGQI